MPIVKPELTVKEFDQLRELADRRRRDVRQQAAHLIARALQVGLDEPEPTRGRHAEARAEGGPVPTEGDGAS